MDTERGVEVLFGTRKPKGFRIAALTALVAAICICLSASAACCIAAGAAPVEEERPLRVLTSFYPAYLFTANVIADISGVSVQNMTAPEAGCLHDYQLLPGDLRALESADVLVINGAGMEGFLDKLRALYPDLPVIEASEGIALLANEAEEGDHDDHDGHGHAREANPHVWVDPRNAAAQARTVARRLGEFDPGRADAYAANAEAYAARLEALYEHMCEELCGLRERNLFTFHESFAYFAAAFDLRVVGVIEREAGTEPSTRDLADTVDQVRAEGLSALFVEPQYPGLAADIIAREAGIRVYTLDPVATGPMTLTAYEEAMERNLQTLLEALH